MVHCLRSLLFLSVISWSSLTVTHAVRFGGNVVPDLNLQRNLRQESHDAKRVKAILLPSERPELKDGEIIEFELFDDNIVKAKVTAYVYHGIDYVINTYKIYQVAFSFEVLNTAAVGIGCVGTIECVAEFQVMVLIKHEVHYVLTFCLDFCSVLASA